MKLVFLDRDGVINRFPGKGQYVTRDEDFFFLPRAVDAVRALTQAGCEIHVVSNQGCVSRGLVTLEALEAMTSRMLREIEAAGGRIRKVHYCVHQKSDNCDCKKPKLKLFKEAIAGRILDLKNVYYVGDSPEDLEAGRDLGCRMVLALSGRTTREDVPALLVQPEAVKDDLWEAAQWILEKKS